MTCEIDADNNGSTDYTANNCTSSSTQQHTYTSAAGATFTAKLTVRDNRGGVSSPQNTSITVNPQKFDLSGTIFKLIANDGSTIGQGTVKMVSSANTLQATVNANGTFTIANVPAGTYTFQYDDAANSSVAVAHEDANQTVSGNLQNYNHWVIERGNNRFGVPFDATIENWYKLFGQGENTAAPGVLKWDLQGAPPTAIVFDDNPALPQTCLQQLEAVYDQFKDDAISIFTDGRITILPRRRGQGSNGVIFISLDPNLGNVSAGTGLATNGKTIIRSDTTYNQTSVCQALASNSDISSLIYEEMGHNMGIPDYQDPNVADVSNEFPGLRTQRPTAAGKLGWAILNHPHTKPGNRAPHKNP
ncbi:MAG: prealbumin-like fold domain-containing protein [Acidobacteria bacterium]|nr:prealbumin-like fold domain-containing protein [Acidobacteriota bacterium]